MAEFNTAIHWNKEVLNKVRIPFPPHNDKTRAERGFCRSKSPLGCAKTDKFN